MSRDRIEPYTALIVQPEVTVVEDRAGIQKNLDRVLNLIHFGVGYFWEVPVRLVVLPEQEQENSNTTTGSDASDGCAPSKSSSWQWLPDQESQ